MFTLSQYRHNVTGIQSSVTARSQHAVTFCGTCSDPIILWRRAIMDI